MYASSVFSLCSLPAAYLKPFIDVRDRKYAEENCINIASTKDWLRIIRDGMAQASLHCSRSARWKGEANDADVLLTSS